MSLYREVLSQALHLTWRGKYLWFFGLFAALLGNGGELEILIRNYNGGFTQNLFPGLDGLAATGVFSAKTFANIGDLLVNDPMSLLFVLAVYLTVFFLAVFLVWLVVTSQATLVNNAALHVLGKKHNFRDGLEAGMKRFWPVFGLNLISKIVVYFFFVLVSLPALISLNQTNFLPASLLFVVSFLIFVPLAVMFSFIIKYAIAYVVVKGSGFIDAIRSGWQLFSTNWLVSIEMAFILFFINFLVGICLIFVFLVLAVPFVFMALLFVKSGLVINSWVILVLGVMLYLLIIILIGSGLAAFQVSSWTGLFIKLISRGGTSKLVRVFEKGK